MNSERPIRFAMGICRGYHRITLVPNGAFGVCDTVEFAIKPSAAAADGVNDAVSVVASTSHETCQGNAVMFGCEWYRQTKLHVPIHGRGCGNGRIPFRVLPPRIAVIPTAVFDTTSFCCFPNATAHSVALQPSHI